MKRNKGSLVSDMPVSNGKTAEERMQAFEDAHRVFFWKPYPWQQRLLEMMRTKNTVAAIASNKIGKCVSKQTLIDTPSGEVSVGRLYEEGKPFDVFAWDGKNKVIAKAQAPFKKQGLHKCYRLIMSDGRIIEAADHHRILTTSGEYANVDSFLGAFPFSVQEKVSFLQKNLLYVDGNSIITSKLIGSQEVYDFEVEEYHNYFAGGLIHHNSSSAVCILISWLFGCEPWNPVDKDNPEAFELFGKYYRKSSLGINPPVNIILTGEDWKLHIGRVLIPEIKKWAPAGWYNTKKNEQGSEYYWEWMNKSTLTIMSYSQDDDLFESFRAQGVIMDEPPPKSKYSAMSRGLLLDCGKTLMNLTPLKEAWILDEIVLSGRRDIGIVDGLLITANPDLYRSDLRLLRDMGLEKPQRQEFFDILLYEDKEKGKPVSDKGHAAERYLEKTVSAEHIEKLSGLKILKLIKDIDPSDVPPRVFGQFKSLVGRVLKEFDMNIHVVKPFDVPTDWPVTVMIDFHLSTPQAITYFAVNKQDIHYVVGEVWKNLSAEEIADDIIRKKKSSAWNIKRVFIDPLSKGDTSYMRNQLGTNIRDTYTIIDEKLSHHGITLAVASKDKESGIKNIQTMLKGVNGLPTFYVFDNCERWLFEVQRWVFDEDGKPAKDGFDHSMENTYRYTLTGTTYEYDQIKPLPKSIVVHTPDSWMGV